MINPMNNQSSKELIPPITQTIQQIKVALKLNLNNVLFDQVAVKLEALFSPSVRVIPEHDWSKIKAIWIPFLHHDYKNQLQRLENIILLESNTDKFGTIQGYLTAPNESYIPYLTTFFNSTWTREEVVKQIMQAMHHVVECRQTLIDPINSKPIRTIIIGKTEKGMLVQITIDKTNMVIDAFPIFDISK